MNRPTRTIGNRLDGLRDVERFVRLICGGGVLLVAGLWIATLSTAPSAPWLLGVASALVGLGGLAAGIRSGIDR